MNKVTNKNNEVPSKKAVKKEVNRTTQLAKTFMGLTLLIFAAYFAIHFAIDSKQKKIIPGKVLTRIEQIQPEKKLSEIQEKIFEKINLQPDLISVIASLDQVTFKTQITNQKIIEKIKSEFRSIFPQKSAGNYNMEVDIFNDEDLNSKSIDDQTPDGEYAGTDLNLVFQISLFEKKSMNKVGEIGITIPMKMLIVQNIE